MYLSSYYAQVRFYLSRNRSIYCRKSRDFWRFAGVRTNVIDQIVSLLLARLEAAYSLDKGV